MHVREFKPPGQAAGMATREKYHPFTLPALSHIPIAAPGPIAHGLGGNGRYLGGNAALFGDLPFLQARMFSTPLD